MRVPNTNTRFRMLVTDTSIRHLDHNELDFSKQKAIEFNLPYINKGVDSFELRIWVNSMIIPHFATILRFSQDKWNAYDYMYYENGKGIDSTIIKKRGLPNDIAKLTAYLCNEDVLNLPSQDAIPNFHDNIADGQTCFIEIATKNFYKALDYHCPEHFNDSYNKKFMEVINFINRYLPVYTPLCLPSK